MSGTAELDELQKNLELIRVLLEHLAVRGLRACGVDEQTQLAGFVEQLEGSGATNLAAALVDLQEKIERSDRSAAASLLQAQLNVRLLERLLTLRVVRGRFAGAADDR